MKAHHGWLWASFLLLAVTAVGCGGGPSTVPVSGTLTIGGEPANDVSLNLVPIDSANGQLATASVKDGKFELFTGNQGAKGAVKGKYKVVLYHAPSVGAEAYGPQNAGSSSPTPYTASTLPFPAKYQDPKMSDKEVEITGATDSLTIDIEKPE